MMLYLYNIFSIDLLMMRKAFKIQFLKFNVHQKTSIYENIFLTVPAAGHEILRSQLNIYTFQITSESVRLIVLIGLNTFSTHNVSENSLKKLDGLIFENTSSKNG